MSTTRITWTQNPRTAPAHSGTRTGTGTYRGHDVHVTVTKHEERGVYAVKARVDGASVFGRLCRMDRFSATAEGARAARAYVDGADRAEAPAKRPKVLRIQVQHHAAVKLAAVNHGCSVSAMAEGIIAGDAACLECLAAARRSLGMR